MRCPILQLLILAFVLHTVPASGQPATYQSRGVRAYLVNYSAVHGDRFLAETAARRFVLIDEAGSRDIALMRAVNPQLPILRYKDIVALHRSMA